MTCKINSKDEEARQAAENARAYNIRKCQADNVHLNAYRILAAIDGNKYAFQNLKVSGSFHAVKVEFLNQIVYLCTTGKQPTIARYDSSWTDLLRRRADYLEAHLAKCRTDKLTYRQETARIRKNFGF